MANGRKKVRKREDRAERARPRSDSQPRDDGKGKQTQGKFASVLAGRSFHSSVSAFSVDYEKRCFAWAGERVFEQLLGEYTRCRIVVVKSRGHVVQRAV